MPLEISCLSAMASTVGVITMPSLYLAIKVITGTTRAISYFHLQPLQCQWFIALSDSSAHFAASFVQLE